MLHELVTTDGERLLAPNGSTDFLEQQKAIFVERGEFGPDDLRIVESAVVEPEPLLCFACARELDWAGPPPSDDPVAARAETPLAGTVFTSRGNYGSTVYDEPFHSQEYLKIAFCDPCLVERRERVLQVRYRQPRSEIMSAGEWDGPGEHWQPHD